TNPEERACYHPRRREWAEKDCTSDPNKADAPRERPLLLDRLWSTGLLELNGRKHACSLGTNRIQSPGIDTQGTEYGWRDLGCAHFGTNCFRFKGGMGQQQDDIGVVMGESAVLGLFGVAFGISNADVRGHDNVRR